MAKRQPPGWWECARCHTGYDPEVWPTCENLVCPNRGKRVEEDG